MEEDVLEVCQCPCNPEYPVIYLDEANRQLIEEVTSSPPVTSGHAKKVDYEYRRKGIVDIFMMFEPCLKVYLPDIDFMKHQVKCWCGKRNSRKVSVNWGSLPPLMPESNSSPFILIIEETNFLYH